MRLYRIAGFFAVGLAVMTPPLRAQDVHYWTYHYGTRSTLLGGAVIGSVMDLSGTYYNPGGLSLIDTDRVDLLMFAKVFHLPRVRLKGFEPSDADLKSLRFDEAPSLVAGSLPFKWLKKHWLGYSFLKRQEVRIDMLGRFSGTLDVVDGISGASPASIDLRLVESLNDPWFGLTWAYPISEHVGIGITQYFSLRSHELIFQTSVQTIDPDGRVKLLLNSRDYKYNNYRTLSKLGVAFDYERFTFGLALTTPSLKIYGSGRLGFNNTAILRDDDPGKADYMAVDFKKGLPSEYRTPLSLGLGLTYKIGSTRIYGTAEWFSGIDEYVVIDGGEFASQSTGELIPNRISHELDSVINFALGIEQRLSRRITAYGSGWTDFSARKPGSTANLSVSDWDIFNFMGGGTLTYTNFELTFGVGYSFGGRGMREQRAVIPGEFRSFVQTFLEGVEYDYRSLKAVLGFSF
jgi:hypothetical protein